MAEPQTPRPHPDLKSLDRLVGRWKVSGDAEGQLEFEWLEGGFFLKQTFEMVYGGRLLKGIEIIGHLQPVGQAPSKEIRSRVYSLVDGATPDYVYQVDGDDITIWFEHKNSGNRMKGRFSPDGNSFSGAWVWPGGGYKLSGTRVK